MINRTLVRTRVIQEVYSSLTDSDKTITTARKDLLNSFADTYTLYHHMLYLAESFTDYARSQNEEAEARARVTHKPYVANTRLVNNRLSDQLFHCDQLTRIVEEKKLRWDIGHNAIAAIYKRLMESEEYKQYLHGEDSYEADRAIWKYIYGVLVAESDEIISALEEMELHFDTRNWGTDIDIVLSFVLKTIRQAKEGENISLLEMFDNENEARFATELLVKSLEHSTEYNELIAQSLKGWDADRIAQMDRVILIVALTEIVEFPNIPLQISMNEYIELAKEYSTAKSSTFVNGTLNSLVKKMDIACKQVK